MTIRTKLKFLSLITIIGLALIASVTIFGLNRIRDTEETAHRRESYTNNLLEIKARALSTIMLDPTLPETREVFSTAERAIEQQGALVIAIIRRADVKEEFKKILDRWASYLKASQALIRLAETDAKAAREQLIPLYHSEFKPVETALAQFIEIRQKEALEGVATAKTVTQTVFWSVISLLAVVSVVNIAAVFYLSRSLRRGIDEVLGGLEPLKQGDLTHEIAYAGKDELGDVVGGVNGFVRELRKIISATRDRSIRLAEASTQLSSAARSMLQSSGQQNDAASSVAASVEEYSISIDQVAESATQAEQKASESGETSRDGGLQVKSAISEIRRIETVVTDATSQMETLGQQAKDISSIANVIKEVADQTNLLALNAAIEAARAGEQGRGFAVVADEVRKLAERTNASAEEISTMVTSVQGSTEQTSNVMQEGNAMVSKGVRQIEHAGDAMQLISERSAEVVAAIAEISSALREQRTAGTEIARNVERIAQMAEAGRNSAEEVSAAAQEMEHVADELQAEVERFRV